MKRKEFQEALEQIVANTETEVYELIRKLRTENAPDGADGTKPVEFDSPIGDWERTADGLARLTAHIYDRVNGVSQSDPKSVRMKMRKLLSEI